jgi:hypothetical protein
VATASLEVGFNDSRVGLVLQHKAPHDAAAFIQRRGRAGRTRGTRPWTVVTLSDYGRDRLAYQAYDMLFAPQVPARTLPVANRFVLKIQGTQALLDWLAVKLRSRGVSADPRELLRAPKGIPQAGPDQVQEMINLLADTLRDTALQDDLAGHLRRTLQISADEAQALLWEQPRALLLAVVPTALRRLRSDWKPVTSDPGAQPGDLLPEFITTALFDTLNVPEVWFELPFTTEHEMLPIERALREAVPGRVSRRYGHRREDHRTWLPLPAAEDGGAIEITAFASRYSHEGTWELPGQQSVRVVRPHLIRLQNPDQKVTDQAQGVPVWGSQVFPSSAGLYMGNIPDPSPWAGRVTSVGFATHAAGNPAEVRRMTTGAECETSYNNGQTVRSTVHYVLNGTPAALGFRLTADGVRFRLAPLDLDKEAVAAHLTSPAWRTFAFTAAVSEDPSIADVANTFQRGWLTLVYLTAFAMAGLVPGQSSERIHASLAGGAWRKDLPEILRVLYRDDAPGGAGPQRLVATLTSLSQAKSVTDCLDKHGKLLWADEIVQRTAGLAQRAYRDTVAAGLLAAALRACPDARERDLIIDVLPPSVGAEDTTIWLTETSGGGLGLVEQLTRHYGTDPRRFWGLVDNALGPNDYEYVDGALTRLLDHVTADPGSRAAQAMHRLRAAGSAHDADAALRELRAAWTELDGYPRLPAVAALSARLLRPGSTGSTDALALAVLRAWDDLQQTLGFEIDARVVAAGVGSRRLQVPGTPDSVTGDQVFSMLWPRGGPARVKHLQYYQPYRDPPLLDRLLAVAAHEERLDHVNVTQPDWQACYADEIARNGAVILTAPAGRAGALSAALRAIPAIEVDRDVLRVYGEVREVTRLGSELRAVVDVREAVQ